jgi:hypothetical protein
LVATVNVVHDSLSLANYAGFFTAGVANGQLLVDDGLKAVQSLGDGLFNVAGIALSEVTFQLNNAAGGISALLTQLGDASGNAVVQAVLRAVRGFAIAPAVAVFNLGSGVADAVLTTAHTGFDLLFDAATSLVTEVSPGRSDGGAPSTLDVSGDRKSPTVQTANDPAPPPTVEPAVAEQVHLVPVTSTAEKVDEPSGEVATETDDAAIEEAPAEDAPEEDGAESEAVAQEATHEAADQESVTDETAGEEAAPRQTERRPRYRR